MIKYFHKSSKEKQNKELNEFHPNSWVYVENATREEIMLLAEEFELDEGHLEDAQDNDEMPRLEREGEQIYFFTRFAHTEDNLIVSTTPLLLIFHPKCLITLSKEPIPALESLLDGKIDINTSQHSKLALQILDRIDDRYEKYLSEISKLIKATRSRLRVEAISNKDFVDFVIIEDGLNELMTALTPMTPILKRLMLGKHFKLANDDRELVEDLLLNNEQSLATCRSSIKSIANIREAYSTIMSNDLNRIIRILTVLTVIISVPTLIASIYGMNIKLPLDDLSLTFNILMLISFVLSLVLLLYFKLKKWL